MTKDLKDLRNKLKKQILSSDKDPTTLLSDANIPIEIRGVLSELIEETLIEKARIDFYTFVRLMAPEVMPDGFIDGAHIKVICTELMELEKGTNKKLMIFLSPGSMKSWLCSKFFTAWSLGRHPTWNVLSVGHSTQFAEDNFGRPTRELIQSELYKKIFPATTVKDDVKASGRWDTDQGGKYFCTGAGSKIAGRRAHLAIMDDVVDEQSADSDVQREKINQWYGPGLRTRLLPEGRELHVQTRWSTEDLAGFLLSGTQKSKKLKQWKVVSVPAIIDEASAKLLGKPVGTSYWPEFWTQERLEELRQDPSMTTAKWNALYMQNPAPAEGNIIKLEWCNLWTDEKAGAHGCTKDETPQLDYIVASLDTAFSEKETADYSAITLWGVFKRTVEIYDGVRSKQLIVPSMFLIDHQKGRWGFPELCRKVMELNKTYKPDGIIIEKKASGQSLIQEMRRRGLPIIEFMPDRDKLSRVHACTALFENNRIWFPDTDWAFELIQDLTKFPSIAKYDSVDSTTQAILWLRDAWHVVAQDPIDESEVEYTPKKKSYWGAIADQRAR